MLNPRNDNPKKIRHQNKWVINQLVQVKPLQENARGLARVENYEHLFKVTLLKKVSQTEKLVYYTTGLEIKPPAGYHFEVITSPGLIESGYRTLDAYPLPLEGEVEIPLIQSHGSPELALPNDEVWLVLRKTQHVNYSMEAFKKKGKTRIQKGSKTISFIND